MFSNRSVIFFLSLVIGLMVFSSCENDEKDIETWTKDQVMVEEATMVESYLSQQGKMKAKLTAPLMKRVYKDTVYTEFPLKLHVDFFDELGNVETWLDSRYGKYFETLNKVYLRDSVVVITVKGDTLKAPDLWWDQNTRLFYSDKYTTYHTKDKQIYGGKGMEATQDLKRVTFMQGGGTVMVPENGF